MGKENKDAKDKLSTDELVKGGEVGGEVDELPAE